jgi:RNA polymerase sigma-70 factor (ECF subfamily)
MYNTSLRIVKDAVEAEDIMQESFLSAFEKIGTYSGTVTFGAWLKKIVLNQSIDSVRRRKKIIFEGIESFKGAEENYFVASYQNEATDLLYRKVLDSIKSLPEKCRNIFSLHLLEGYDHEEISEILAISTSTSRSQYSRARSILRKEMKR